MLHPVQRVPMQATCRTAANSPAPLALPGTKSKQAPAAPNHQAGSGVKTTDGVAKATNSIYTVPAAAMRGHKPVGWLKSAALQLLAAPS